MANENGATVELIKRWLDDCRARQPSCQVPSTATLPDRLIDVGISSETVSLHVSGSGEAGCYVALSHCKGGHTPLATTTANLAEHQRFLRFDDNPKTFAQAVQLTRDLGFKYLWIDSLCIVQDDPKDWEIEAAKMKDVYSNSALTLSADSAEDTSQGLFGTPAARVAANRTRVITTEDPSGLPVEICPHSPLAAPF
ncbi:HET-domain-containing protein [Parathielavia appendiculata]|uniref:HET-domain-containing protein n=1 Tax=Parathielavia appendiculata TaxID=2587402 RepID=A0AAN6Z6Z7_9PEZI|nr:HET-domain-containing protein [Parathielavia appendiculata]